MPVKWLKIGNKTFYLAIGLLVSGKVYNNKDPPKAGDQYHLTKTSLPYLTAGLSGLVVEEVSVFIDEVSGVTEEESSGALCIGVELESDVVSSVVELSVHEAMIDVIAMIARNFFI